LTRVSRFAELQLGIAKVSEMGTSPVKSKLSEGVALPYHVFRNLRGDQVTGGLFHNPLWMPTDIASLREETRAWI
jgi:hypothetical protein